MAPTRLKLGEMLKEAGLISAEQIESALKEQKSMKRPIGDVLVSLGFVSEKDIAETLAVQLDVPFLSGERGMLKPRADQKLENIITSEVSRQYSVIPLSCEENVLTVALVDPTDVVAIDNLKKITGCEINCVIATKSDINRAQDLFYGEQRLLKEAVDQTYQLESSEKAFSMVEETGSLDEVTAMARSAPVIKLVDLLLMDAIKSRASDIHIEPFERKLIIRYRIDGDLYTIPPPSERLIAPLISRVKIMSKMDISEKRLPQDGGFSLKMGNRIIDFRVSSLPTIYGEKIVIRLLDKSSVIFKLEEMGFSGKGLLVYREAINKPNGLVFITGPTGSGKSTTLYASLMEIATSDKNVMTIEDPVEYRFEGINQVQVKLGIGLTFANGVRTALRQDPDVILVGEVRDSDTAEACVRAALTGHLVLSTLHTNDAPSAVIRLKDLGMEPFLIGSSLLLVQAQRLVRRLCSKCKESYQPSGQEREQFKLTSQNVYRPKGCEDCRKSGYKGRIGIFEVMPVTGAIKESIYKGANTSELRVLALKEGMASLLIDGMNKVNAGITSIEEVLAAAYEYI